MSSPPRILFVDDELQVRNAFLRRFRGRGWDVQVASGAEEALRILRTDEFEVLVTDLRMPKVDGLTLIARARKIRPHLGCLIVTGLPDLDLNNDVARDSAIVGILPKPWNVDEIAASIEHARAVYRERSGRNLEGAVEDATHSLLLVEDNEGDAVLVSRYLRSARCDVTVATRLSEALDLVRSGNFDVVLSDLTLPDARGLDCVRRLTAAAQESAVVVLTGLEDDTIATRALQLGAQDYMTKDELRPESLRRMIRYAVERKRTEQRVRALASRDALTGLANRTTFQERLNEALARSERSQEPIALLFVDLDRFKAINDTFGHAAGDIVVRDVASRLSEAVREYDVVARLGGDEFAVLLSELDDPLTPQRVADRILDALALPIPLGDATVAISASIGIATSPDAGRTAEQLVKSADFAMYAAKRAGRNGYRSFNEVDDPRSTRRHQLLSDLRASLDERRFVLHYQPQFRVENHEPVGAEVLLRWQRQDGTLVPPGEFIPLLEDSGLIVDVGAFVMREACRTLAAWRRDGAPDFRIAVNLSPKQFESDGLVDVVQRALADADLEPSALELEITESLLMRDTTRTSNTLGALAELGVRIALDDFGTGYSSLAYLERFDVDVLKIDRSFVQPLDKSAVSAGSVAGAIVSLGHQLGLEVIAEGVETVRQLDALRWEGCDVVQGYLLGRPAADWRPPRLAARVA
ncbi:MAG: EAL domain-containing protein [Deltaproteobacteria bacterium]